MSRLSLIGMGTALNIDDSATQLKIQAMRSSPLVITSHIAGATNASRETFLGVSQVPGVHWGDYGLTADVSMAALQDVILDKTEMISDGSTTINGANITLTRGIYNIRFEARVTGLPIGNNSARYEFSSTEFGHTTNRRNTLQINREDGGQSDGSSSFMSMRVHVVAASFTFKVACGSLSSAHTLKVGSTLIIDRIDDVGSVAPIDSVECIFAGESGSRTVTSPISQNWFSNSSLDGGPSGSGWGRSNCTFAADADLTMAWKLTQTAPASSASMMQVVGHIDRDLPIAAQFQFMLYGPSDIAGALVVNLAGTDTVIATVNYTAATDSCAVVASYVGGATSGAMTLTKSGDVYTLDIPNADTNSVGMGDVTALLYLDTKQTGGSFHWVDACLVNKAAITGTYRTGNVHIPADIMPSVLRHATKHGRYEDVTVTVRGKDSFGNYCTPAASVSYRTGMRETLVFSASGMNVLTVGESALSVGADMHFRGRHASFPTTAGEHGGMAFQRRDTGADVSYAVTQVSGTAPNRTATLVLDAPVKQVVMRAGTGGANQTASQLSALFTGITGGTITQVGWDRVHWFGADGTFTSSFAGAVRALVVAGGGAGAYTATVAYSGGGGAGGMRDETVTIAAQSYAVTVGLGGTAPTSNGSGGDGGASSIGTLISTVGGGGGGGGAALVNGRAGGSGGGGSGSTGTGTTTGGAGTTGQGNAGQGGIVNWAGGGGGAGEAASVQGRPGGGNGLQSNIVNGTNVYYAGGGGGNASTFTGVGGLGGGGSSGSRNGGTNLGGGGYSWPGSGVAGNGGSGVVVVRFPMQSAAFSNRFVSAI